MSKKESNKIRFITETVIKVMTSKGYFICDYEDWVKYNCDKIYWGVQKFGSRTYIRGTIVDSEGKRRCITFHRYIMEAKESEQVSHQDKCTLNNTRNNLVKFAIRPKELKAKKEKHTTSCKGVNWNAKTGKWTAKININKKPKYLGSFATKEQAIAVRKDAELWYEDEITWSKMEQERKKANKPRKVSDVVKDIIKGVE